MKKGDFYTKHKWHITTVVGFIVILCFVFMCLLFGYRYANKTISNFVIEEQRRELTKIEYVITETEEHLEELNYKLSQMGVSQKKYLSDEKSGELLQILEYIEDDSLKIENFLTHYYNDYSVNLYPDEENMIDKKIRALWNMHVALNRLVRYVEYIAITDCIYTYNVDLINVKLKSIAVQIEYIKNIN